MALSFEDEVRAYFKHRAEQTPVLHALEHGEMTVADIDVRQALEMLSRMDATHSNLIHKIAREIDKLRVATNSG